MAKDWRNQRNTKPGGTTPTTLRISNDMKARIRKTAEKHNTTATAIIDEGLRLFFENNPDADGAKKPAKPALFE